MNLSTNKLLALAALVAAIVSFLVAGPDPLVVAVILLALALLV